MSNQPAHIWRMPTHFGPHAGVRQGPDGERFAFRERPLRESWTLYFRTEARALAHLLPPQFKLAGEPVVSIEWTRLSDLEWLAGRGYSMLGVRYPARFDGAQDKVQGLFLAVLWENLAEPIISGREELGYNKVFADLPGPTVSRCGMSAQASWQGHRFFDMNIDSLIEANDSAWTPPWGLHTVAGTLHHKYIPSTGNWGVADVDCAVLTPATGGHYRARSRRIGQGQCAFVPSTWEQMPTQFHIVNALASLPILEWLGAVEEIGTGGKDLRDQRMLS